MLSVSLAFRHFGISLWPVLLRKPWDEYCHNNPPLLWLAFRQPIHDACLQSDEIAKSQWAERQQVALVQEGHFITFRFFASACLAFSLSYFLCIMFCFLSNPTMVDYTPLSARTHTAISCILRQKRL